jgi:hypothetical protein
VAADPDPARGEGGLSCKGDMLFDRDPEVAGAGVVSEFDSAGGGEVRPGGAIVWAVVVGR